MKYLLASNFPNSYNTVMIEKITNDVSPTQSYKKEVLVDKYDNDDVDDDEDDDKNNDDEDGDNDDK